MISADCKVHVIDFGLARFLEDNTLTHTGQLVGTPLYMSPEQVAAFTNIDHRTDVYSLGLVLYEMLCLQPPIIAQNREELLGKIITQKLEPLVFQNRDVPSELASIVHQATAKDPDKRYQSAEEFANDLQRFLAQEKVEAVHYAPNADLSEQHSVRPNSAVIATILGFSNTLHYGVMAILAGLGGTSNVMSLPSAIFCVLFGASSFGIWRGKFPLAVLAFCIHLVTLFAIWANLAIVSPAFDESSTELQKYVEMTEVFIYSPAPLIASILALIALPFATPWLLRTSFFLDDFKEKLKGTRV